MKKLSILFATLAICLGTTAWGELPTTCHTAPEGCPNASASASCAVLGNTCCTTAKEGVIVGKPQLVTNTYDSLTTTCSSQSLYSCGTCNTVTEIYCAPGYVAESLRTDKTVEPTCAECPAGGTCAGYEEQPVANKGYYCEPYTLSCTRCPAITFNGVQLHTGQSPSALDYAYQTTSSTGATSEDSCYIPDGDYYASDSTGVYKITFSNNLPSPNAKTYIKCANEDTYLSGTGVGNTCYSCGSQSRNPANHSNTTCTCNTGYSTNGTTSGGTTTTNAACSAISYTITYNLNGGTNNSSNRSNFTINDLPITLQAPTRSNYNFAGWYTTSAFTSGTQITELTANQNYTLYAKWTAETSYTITYSKQSGAPSSCSVSGLSPTSYTASSLPVTLPTPATCSGYTFNGWYTTSTGSTKATSISTGTTGNKTYYANWTADETEPTTGTCPAGEYYSDSSESCNECLSGYYCPGVTYTVGGDTFQGLESCGYSTMQKTATCPDNAHDCYYNCDSGTSPAGSDSKSDCYSCSSGCNCGTTLYFTCDDGYVKSGNTCVAATSVTTCAAGTYYYKSASAEPTCNTCPKGYYCPGVSQFSATVGMFGNYPCPAGKYNPTTGATSVDACTDCNGTYYTDDIFFEGAYSNCRGAPAQGCCAYCSTLYGTSNPISKTCTQIQTGKECVPGTFLEYGTPPICAPCLVGYYCPGGVLRYKDMNERYYDATSQQEVFGTGAFRCPTSGGFVAQTTFNQATNTPAAITDCFIPAGYSESDDTGNWEYGQACYYTE